MEKLLQKNYFLHQSARDGYRSYLQAYASYSLKKIFDVNQLDLAKVGKSFGFSVPPRVNVNIGGGKGGAGRSGKKRKREEGDDEENDEEWEEIAERFANATHYLDKRLHKELSAVAAAVIAELRVSLFYP